MKVRLQYIIKACVYVEACCVICRYNKCGELENYYRLCGNSPELAKALYTNEEVELHENDSERIN